MPGSPFEARVKLTALLFWTALILAIAGELDVPVAVAVPLDGAEGVDDPVLELPPPVSLPGKRCRLLPSQARAAIPAPPVSMPHKKLRLLCCLARCTCAYLFCWAGRLLPVVCRLCP